MAEQDDGRKKHFILKGAAETERFRLPRNGGGDSAVPERDRRRHGRSLLRQLEVLRPLFLRAREAQEAAGEKEGFGLKVEFESFPNIELAFESLERKRAGIELLNVRRKEKLTLATVFVPDGELKKFEDLVRDYLDESKDTVRGPKNRKLLNTISEIREAALNALWTDDPDVLPATDEEMFWWEIWLPVRNDREATTEQFKRLVQDLDFRIAPGELQFPERTVLMAYGSAGQMKRSMLTLNSVAELRRAKETAEFFDSCAPAAQHARLDGLLKRLTVSGRGAEVPHVCLFDTGANYEHPLVGIGLDAVDLHTVEPSWGTNDTHGHGTEMAGLALAGDLTQALASQSAIKISHRLESVKLLSKEGTNGRDARHHGYLTVEAVARPEITAPRRHRLFSMAVTARDNRDRGRPSAWSAAIDRLAADAQGFCETPRLFVISAGNIDDPQAWASYPLSNATDGIHDPGQSWNALTVGAVTHLARITEPDTDGLQPVAPVGGLSPFSTTSRTWEPKWPMKPDVLFEGGNAAKDSLGAVWLPSLSLLTTHSKPSERLFTTANATSAASALAARMAAGLMAEYPKLWPETIRAL
ncbi:MAG: S8 family peptidase, partial [Candidatus Competibacter sp.]|nr:S8 family peptidase [Candidatus Competibacter sp.]